jgi:hypothetical protein
MAGFALGPQAAQAATTTLTVTNASANYVVHHANPRTNTKSKNSVSFRTTSMPVGGSINLGMRSTSSASSTQFASGESFNTLVTMMNVNGNPWQPAGTFYLNSQPEAQCGGSGCGQFTWTATFNYDILWY